MTDFFKSFFKKTFYIELEDSLVYPSAQRVCDAIEEYCINNKFKYSFVTMHSPITFNLDDGKYQAKVTTSRGGYYINCRKM